jgi:hypothetical protein
VTTTTQIPAGPVTAELYARIQQFYAEQMHLIDTGDADAWARTFAEDGVFAANAYPQPVYGRAAIAAAVRRTTAELAERSLVRRHFLGSFAASRRPDGTLFVRSYAQILETPRGGQSRVLMMTVCEDVLSDGADGLRVASRQVYRDDIG